MQLSTLGTATLKNWSVRLAGLAKRLPVPSVKQACIDVHGYTPRGRVRCGLSDPSKMPGKGWSLPALLACPTGAKLAKRPGTVCSTCYACQGRYTEDGVAASLRARWNVLNAHLATVEGSALWCASMAKLITKQSPAEFRWHDSGDLFCDKYVLMIFVVIRMTPGTRHWIPTKELNRISRLLLREGYSVPRNVCVRISAFKLGAQFTVPPALKRRGIRASSVGVSKAWHQCPAYKQEGFCGDCRECWQRTIPSTNYPQH